MEVVAAVGEGIWVLPFFAQGLKVESHWKSGACADDGERLHIVADEWCCKGAARYTCPTCIDARYPLSDVDTCGGNRLRHEEEHCSLPREAWYVFDAAVCSMDGLSSDEFLT